MVQKCGSASGMSTDSRRSEWPICRQSVATMLVAVGNAGGALELGHDLAAGVAVFRAAGVLGVGQQVTLAFAQGDGLVQRPGAVGVEGDAGIGEARLDRGDRLHLLRAPHHAALELEVGEAVARCGGLGQTGDRIRVSAC